MDHVKMRFYCTLAECLPLIKVQQFPYSMDLEQYRGLLRFLSSGCTLYPDDLLQKSTKADRNKRDNFKTKAKKFFLKGEDLYRLLPGTVVGAKVVTREEVNDILAEFHGSAFGGHSGVNRTIDAINSRYWWNGLTDDVKDYVRSCEACQKSDPLKPAQRPDMQPIKVSYPFELVGVDLVGPLATTEQGNKYIFTATDYYTKWVEAFPIPSKTATDVAKCFKKLFARHGAMNAILTDQGREFINQVNDQLCKEWHIQHRVTAAYHPQTNGLDERTNQTLKATLRKMVNEHQDNWDDFLDGALFAQRTKRQSTTKYSPFFLLYGREAVYPSQLPKDFGGSDTQPMDPQEQHLDSYVQQRQQMEETTKEKVKGNVEKAQEKQKKDYKQRTERGRSYTTFAVGDIVLTHNSRKAGTKAKGDLTPNYGGPYTITNLEGRQATLQNSSGLVLKKTFNVDRLKMFKTQQQRTTEPDTTAETVDKTDMTGQVRECQQTTTEPDRTAKTVDKTDMTRKAREYLQDIGGELKQLINFAQQIHLRTPTVFNLDHLLRTCPLQSFIAEVSRDEESEMDDFSSQILPLIRHLDITLTQKTTLTMLISCVCVTAAKLFQPVMTIAETLKEKPSHLWDTTPQVPLQPSQRLSVGGESLESIDLATLDEGACLNDKIINSFLGLLKSRHNLTSTEDHVFVLPSYTAELWNEGNLDHWMFKKVQFSKFKHILMPINVNRNHWVLMVVNIVERTVAVLDSMNGQNAGRWVDFWRKFMERRELLPDVTEMMGHWQHVHASSNKQTDGNSCGIFTLMNAECIIKGVPVHVMRQVHCKMYREYARECLLEGGTTNDETACDMPNCEKKSGVSRWVQCSVCGRWFHTKCCGLSTKSAIQDDFECCICSAMYR